MAEAFLLPCACGQSVRVGKAQAGQTVQCGCGKSLSVPTLRGLRELQLAPEEAKPKGAKPAAAWGPWHGAAFSGGLAVAAVALLLFAVNLFYFVGSSQYSVDRTDDVIDFATSELNDLSAEELLDEWNEVVHEGLGQPITPLWIAAQQSAGIYRWRMIAFGSLGLLAVLVSLGAVFFSRR